MSITGQLLNLHTCFWIKDFEALPAIVFFSFGNSGRPLITMSRSLLISHTTDGRSVVTNIIGRNQCLILKSLEEPHWRKVWSEETLEEYTSCYTSLGHSVFKTWFFYVCVVNIVSYLKFSAKQMWHLKEQGEFWSDLRSYDLLLSLQGPAMWIEMST